MEQLSKVVGKRGRESVYESKWESKFPYNFEDFRVFTDELPQLTQLVWLELPFLSGKYSSTSFSDFSRALLRSPVRLRGLIFNTSNFSDASFNLFTQCAPNLESLETLDVSPLQFESERMKMFTRMLPHLKKLRVLKFGTFSSLFIPMQSEVIENFFIGVGTHLRELRVFSVSKISSADGSVSTAFVGHAAPHLTKLRELTLGNFPMPAAEYINFIKTAIPVLPTLTVLEVPRVIRGLTYAQSTDEDEATSTTGAVLWDLWGLRVCAIDPVPFWLRLTIERNSILFKAVKVFFKTYVSMMRLRRSVGSEFYQMGPFVGLQIALQAGKSELDKFNEGLHGDVRVPAEFERQAENLRRGYQEILNRFQDGDGLYRRPTRDDLINEYRLQR